MTPETTITYICAEIAGAIPRYLMNRCRFTHGSASATRRVPHLRGCVASSRLSLSTRCARRPTRAPGFWPPGLLRSGSIGAKLVGNSPEPAEPIGKLQDPLFLALLWVNCPATSRDCSARCQVHPRSSSAPEGPEVCRLAAGGSEIRTLGPAAMANSVGTTFHSIRAGYDHR